MCKSQGSCQRAMSRFKYAQRTPAYFSQSQKILMSERSEHPHKRLKTVQMSVKARFEIITCDDKNCFRHDCDNKVFKVSRLHITSFDVKTKRIKRVACAQLHQQRKSGTPTLSFCESREVKTKLEDILVVARHTKHIYNWGTVANQTLHAHAKKERKNKMSYFNTPRWSQKLILRRKTVGVTFTKSLSSVSVQVSATIKFKAAALNEVR